MTEVLETGKLKQIIDKIETIEQERLESADLLKDAFNEAKSKGFDVKIIKHVLVKRQLYWSTLASIKMVHLH